MAGIGPPSKTAVGTKSEQAWLSSKTAVIGRGDPKPPLSTRRFCFARDAFLHFRSVGREDPNSCWPFGLPRIHLLSPPSVARSAPLLPAGAGRPPFRPFASREAWNVQPMRRATPKQ
jgi:hypothetical protein